MKKVKPVINSYNTLTGILGMLMIVLSYWFNRRRLEKMDVNPGLGSELLGSGYGFIKFSDERETEYAGSESMY